jgi:hypothetical protein
MRQASNSLGAARTTRLSAMISADLRGGSRYRSFETQQRRVQPHIKACQMDWVDSIGMYSRSRHSSTLRMIGRKPKGELCHPLKKQKRS